MNQDNSIKKSPETILSSVLSDHRTNVILQHILPKTDGNVTLNGSIGTKTVVGKYNTLF